MKTNNSFSRIYKKILYLIFILFYGKVIFLNKKIKEVQIKKINSINNINVNKFNYKFFEIKQGRLFTNYVECLGIISKNFLIKEISFQQINGILKKTKNQILETGTPKIIKKFPGKILSLSQGASGHNNYSHWLLDILPKLKMASEKYNLQKIDFFYFSKINSFQKQSLKFLNLNPNKFIDSNIYRHVQAPIVFAVTHPNYFYGKIFDAHSNLPLWIVIYLRKTFLNKKFKSKKKYKNIFIDRSDSTQSHCKLINNQQIINYLKKNNFKILKLSKLNFKDQISIFSNCKNIVAPHGAGLANLVFCKKKTKVIEIIPKNHQNYVYKRISEINKLDYKSIRCDFVSGNNLGDMFLDIKLLRKYLS
tara:strand:+ start:847 stop:1935 length:1089 start_codon:yes stop_codon:yes gene_type:complete